jgi:hypothetical protein
MSTKRIAPWPDYAGNVIHEGDTIVHPSGERGRVEFDDSYIHETGKWRVRYGDNPAEAQALCLQIGDRGMAVVTSDPPPQPAVLVPADELAALREDAERYRWLRDVAVDVDDAVPMAIQTDYLGGIENPPGYLFGSELDQAIDCARGVK